MNKEDLTKKIVALEEKFNQLQKQREDINSELLRLQGEYRALSLIIEGLDEPKKGKK